MDRTARRENRSVLSEKWLTKQQAEKEAKKLRKKNAEILGYFWLRDKVAHDKLCFDLKESVANMEHSVGTDKAYDAKEKYQRLYVQLLETSTDQNVQSDYQRRPLGTWTKGKVWSKFAEMYV